MMKSLFAKISILIAIFTVSVAAKCSESETQTYIPEAVEVATSEEEAEEEVPEEVYVPADIQDDESLEGEDESYSYGD